MTRPTPRQLPLSIFPDEPLSPASSQGQLLKWIGSKHRSADAIIGTFPPAFERYVEPFLGSGAVLGRLAPNVALASDAYGPLMEIWTTLQINPSRVKQWYADRYDRFACGNKRDEYERVKAEFNRSPNGADLLFLSRSCYGGVIRFRKRDGYMSTPVGVHTPMRPESFAERVDTWHASVGSTVFRHCDFKDILSEVKHGDLVYCDPPYSESQAILYGAQSFNLYELFLSIENAKARGARIIVSIDGTKRSGKHKVDIHIPAGLFERELFVDCGRSMLKRLQMKGETLESERVADRLLITY